MYGYIGKVLLVNLTDKTYEIEDLPEEWSLTEKRDYLEKRKAGMGKARKLLYVLLPLLITVGISYIELWFFT